MAHHRKIIRDAVVTALTGLASTGSNVFATRRYPVAAAQLPALCVYTLSEDSEVDSMGTNRSLLRTLDMIIEAVTQVNDTLDNTLDQLCLEVETALGLDPTLGGRVHDCNLASTRIAIRGDAEAETGSAVMNFSVIYRTRANDPSTSTKGN